MKKKIQFPEQGMEREALLAQMKSMSKDDANWRSGRNFAYVYFAGDEILETVKEAFGLFFSENALNPTAFPSLRKMEAEVIGMTADLLGSDGSVTGSLTSGGTESILMACKAARAWGKKERGIEAPEIILPETAHPAFHKACYYFGMTAKVAPVGTDFRAQPEVMEGLISDKTVLIVASAPSYPQGVIDPVESIADIAKKHNILCHVDACVGGFFLPFLRAIKPELPAFDFSIDGVTSMSADIHKYGYAAKGASVILYKNAALRKHQFYVYTEWSGGIYGSPAVAGTRPGGAIAGAWAALNFIGKEGYIQLAKRTMAVREKLLESLEDIPDLMVYGKPDMSIVCLGSDTLDIYEVGDELSVLGWLIDRQQNPASLHLTLTPAHEQSIDRFVRDLHFAVNKAKKLSLPKIGNKLQVKTVKGLRKILSESAFEKFQQFAAKYSDVGGKRSAAMYGMMGDLQASGNLDEMILEFLDKLMSDE
jgi:glutamate/tyrosine decarboxylase-like PLP-dependent enzyme